MIWSWVFEESNKVESTIITSDGQSENKVVIANEEGFGSISGLKWMSGILHWKDWVISPLRVWAQHQPQVMCLGNLVVDSTEGEWLRAQKDDLECKKVWSVTLTLATFPSDLYTRSIPMWKALSVSPLKFSNLGTRVWCLCSISAALSSLLWILG